MPGNSTKGKGKRRRLDKYYQLAKEQGYRARSAFKLVQLEKKYNFLSTARAVIDLCAAPGGWMQVARKYAPVSAVVIGVDLVTIAPIRGCVALQADITTAQCRAMLQREMRDWKVDVVLNDGAPSMGSTWIHDAYTQSELCLHALRLAAEFLMPGGTFVSKVFRSKDYNAIYWVLTQLFDKVEATKPVASREISAEIYVVCRGFLAPKKIDPRLLDPKHVFKEINPSTPATKLLSAKKKLRPNREGYDDNIGQIIHKRACVTQFIDAVNPGQFLGLFHEISFDPAVPLAVDHNGRVMSAERDGAGDADDDIIPDIVRESTGNVEAVVAREAARLAAQKARNQQRRATAQSAMSREAALAFYAAHPQTPPQLAAQLRDIRLLSRTDLKKILMWRERMRRARQELFESMTPGGKADGAAAAAADDDDELDSDAKLEKELEAELDRADARRRQRLRKVRKQRAKARIREALGMSIRFDEDLTDNMDVFTLDSVKSLDQATDHVLRHGLDGYADKRALLDQEVAEADEVARAVRFRLGPELAEIDSDSLSKDAEVDDMLEVMYQDYKEAARLREAAARAKSLRGISSHKRMVLQQEAESLLADEDRSRRQAAADVDAELRFGKASKKRRRDDGSASGEESGASEEDVSSEERRKLERLSAVPATKRAAMWYDQALFEGIEGAAPEPVAIGGSEDDADDADDDDNDADGLGGSGSGRDDDSDDSNVDGGGARKRKSKAPRSVLSALERADKRRAKITSGNADSDDDEDNFEPYDSGNEFDESGSDSDDEGGIGLHGVTMSGKHDALDDLFVGRDEEQRDLEEESDSIDERKIKTKKSRRELEREAKRNEKLNQKGDKPDDTPGFEIVPLDESESDTDSDKGGQDAQLEALAYARALVNGRRRRDELEDNAFNRRAFADTEAAPEWFVDNERQHTQVGLPVTREDMIAVRAQEIALNTRPIKRIVEARMRKQRRAKRRMERMKQQANSIADQTDIDDKAKMRLLEKLYRGGAKKERSKERIYMVTSKSGKTHKARRAGAAKGPISIVDPRDKKDKRARKVREKREKRKSRSVNKKRARKS